MLTCDVKKEKKTLNADVSQNVFYFQWHFIEACNLRCTHCYQQNHQKGPLSDREAFKIVQILTNSLDKWNKHGRISLTGGEPFLAKELLFNLLDCFEQSSRFSWMGILTNGTLIDDSDFEQLSKYCKLKEVQVSLDGASETTHDKIRGSGTFTKATTALKKLKEYGLSASIMFTLQRHNMHDVLKLIELADNFGIDALTIERIIPAHKNDYTFPPDELKQIYERIYEKKRQLETTSSKLKIRVSRPLWVLIDENAGGFCPAGFSSLAILHDGTLLPCRRLEIPIGNILTDGLFRPWYQSEVLWRLRNKRLLGAKCKDCNFLGQCGGCRAIAYAATGDYMADDPQCWRSNIN